MNSRQHAQLARQLIAACGTLCEAEKVVRVGKTLLSMYQSPDDAHFMPADVIADLEAYCGQPIYSRALFDAATKPNIAADILSEGCEAAEATAALQRTIRLASKDGRLTPRELDAVDRMARGAQKEIDDVLAAVEAARS